MKYEDKMVEILSEMLIRQDRVESRLDKTTYVEKLARAMDQLGIGLERAWIRLERAWIN